MHGLRLVAAVALMVATNRSLDAQAQWRLQELFRLGGADEGLASFNDIRDFELDARGQVWVLDFQTQTLRLFGADGSPIRQLARKGRGPGELTNANGIRRAPDGRMVLRDHSNNRFTVFAADGSALPSVAMQSFGYGYVWEAAFDAESRLVEIMTVRRDTSYKQALVRHSRDFARADTMFLPERCGDLPPPRMGVRGRRGFAGIPYEPRLAFSVGTDGSFWCAHTDEYSLKRMPFGGSAVDRSLTLTNLARIPIAAAERDSALVAFDSFMVRIGGATDPFDRGSIKRDRGQLIGFVPDDVGRMWVLRQLPSRRYEFDVWDVAGSRRLAVVPVQASAGAFPRIRVRGDRLAILAFDDDDLPVIVVYRILGSR